MTEATGGLNFGYDRWIKLGDTAQNNGYYNGAVAAYLQALRVYSVLDFSRAKIVGTRLMPLFFRMQNLDGVRVCLEDLEIYQGKFIKDHGKSDFLVKSWVLGANTKLESLDVQKTT